MPIQYADAMPFENNRFTVLEKPAYKRDYRWVSLGVNQEVMEVLNKKVDQQHKEADRSRLSIVQTDKGYELQNERGVNVLNVPYRKIEPLGRYFKVYGNKGVGVYGQEGIVFLFHYEDVSLYDEADDTTEIFVLKTKNGDLFVKRSVGILWKH